MPKKDQTKVESDAILAWKCLEYENLEKGWKWFLYLGFIVFAIIGYSLFTRDWFMVAIVIITTGILFYYLKQNPREREYKITELGVSVDGRLYPYNEIHSFWMILKPNFQQLNIMFNRKYLPQLSITIPEKIDPLKIRMTLGDYIPEQENRQESMIDLLSRIFKL